MLKNYLIIAWRQLAKNRLYAAINILGLTVGLGIYLFSNLLVGYERSYDTFFANAARVFTVGSLFGPTANIGVSETDGIYTAFKPFIEAEIEEVEAIARTVGREYLVSLEDDQYYEDIVFADPALLDVFDFTYLEGDDSALDDPTGVLLTREAAVKFFGREPALGRLITLDHRHALHVRAVIEDLPANTHLNGSVINSEKLALVAPLEALNGVSGYDLAGNWNNLSSGDFTYLLMPEGTSRSWLQTRLDGIYEAHFPERAREFITGIKARPLVEANTILWDAVGLPVLDSIALLGLLVLVVAIVNYTNLATAQSLGRAREIGLRKTMGAGRRQLVIQFLVESLCVALLAMLLALAAIEVLVPAFNTATGRGLEVGYLDVLPWLVVTTVVVGLVAGAYPAWLITQASPIDALREGSARGARGSRFRSLMLGLQFAITILMLAVVLVMVLQNRKIEQSAQIYPKTEIITLERLDVAGIAERLDTLKNELGNIPGVTRVSYVSQLPYEQSNSQFDVSPRPGGEDDFLMSQIVVDEDFFATFDMTLLAGRTLDAAISADTLVDRGKDLAVNAVVNELALERLGLGTPQSALGAVFYERRGESEPRVYTIVGVLPDQNYLGFHNRIKPTVFMMSPGGRRFAAVRVEGVAMGQTLSAVEAVWQELIPDYPIQSTFLEEEFAETFGIYTGLTWVLAGFAAVALLLSLIGLFGLAAFMAAGRTREIGVRKVMGANVVQIVRLLIWQFSRPVLWSLLLALPLAWLAANQYLSFFADRITLVGPIVAGAGFVSVFFAWGVVAIHAARVARASPIHALRYE